MLPKTHIWTLTGCSESQYSHYQEKGWLAPCQPVGKHGKDGPTWLCPSDNTNRIQTIQQIPKSAHWNEEVSLELLRQSKPLYKASAVQDALMLTLQRAEVSLAMHRYEQLSSVQARKRIQQRTAMDAQRYPEWLPLWASQELFYRFSGLQAPSAHEPDLALASMKAAVLKSSNPDTLAAMNIIIKGIANKSIRHGIDVLMQHMGIDHARFKQGALIGHTCYYPHTIYQLLTPLFIILLIQNTLDAPRWQDGQQYFTNLYTDAGKRLILPSNRASRPDWQR